jgi:two-component system catabolic regulation response regulator CreB/two-component system response regulator ChvI
LLLLIRDIETEPHLISQYSVFDFGNVPHLTSAVTKVKDISSTITFRSSQQSSNNKSIRQDNNNNKKLRILAVDDEKDITLLVKKGLEGKGFEVDVYNDPKLVLEEFRPGKYDILITDIRMPGMDGFELYSKIRKIDDKLRVFFLSAIDVYQQNMRLAFPHLHSNAFISKPVTIEKLAKIIDQSRRL